MAEFKATKSAGDSSVPKNAVLTAKGVYVASGDEAAADTLNMATIPAGATLLGMVLTADGGTASMTMTVGDGTTADLFGTVTNATAAFVHIIDGTEGIGTTFAADTDVIITTAVAAPTADDTYTCVAYYVM